MEEIESHSIFDIKESDPQLEKHRKDVIEKYLEFELVFMIKLRDRGKNLDDFIERMKAVLWYVKNERLQQIENEFGL